MENNNKNLRLRTGAYIFAASFFMNISVHLLGHYVYFITKEVDLIIYAVELTGFYIAYKMISASKANELKIVCMILKGIIIAECISCFIYATDGCLLLLLVPCTVVKYFLEFFFYLALPEASDSILKNTDCDLYESHIKKSDGFIFSWKAYHFVGAFFLAIAVSSKTIEIYYFLLAYLVLRIILIFRNIKLLDVVDKNQNLLKVADTENDKKANATHSFIIFKVIKYSSLVLLAILFVIYLVLKNTYSGDLYLVDENGEFVTDQKAVNFTDIHDMDEEHYQYEVKNMLPEWTLESDSKYGLLNVVTGENTGPIYDEILEFDVDENAWDGNGHIINSSGEVITTLPSSILKTRSDHQRRIDSFLSYFYTESESDQNPNVKDNDKLKGPMVCEYVFFRDGIGIYFDEFSCKYGLIDDNGNLLTEAKYDSISNGRRFEKTDHTLFIAYFDDHGTTTLFYINKDLKVILEDSKEHEIMVEKIDYNQGYIAYRDSSDNHNSIKYIKIDNENSSNDDDNTLDYKINDTAFKLGGNDVINARSLDKNDNKAYALTEDYEVLFASEQYTAYYSYLVNDSDTVDYLVARNLSGNYELINLDGEQILPGEFNDVLDGEGVGVFYLCRSIDDPDYSYRVFIIDDGECVAELLARDYETRRYFGYGSYYDLEQEEYFNYYWRQNAEDKCEIYSLDGTLLDTVHNYMYFEYYHKKPETDDEIHYDSTFPEAVTSKYKYVEYVDPNLFAVSNERPAYIGY